MRIDAHTRVVALLGYPVEHSLSPLIHNTAFGRQALNLIYVAHPVRPEDLPAAVDGLRALRFAGANVTIPHKQAVLDLADELSDQARAVGAVNTLVAKEGDGGRVSLYGDNTDVAGFLAPLRPYAERLHGAPMVILGAGGAARAVAYGLLTTYAPASLTIAARTLEKAERLAAEVRAFGAGVPEAVRLDRAGGALRESQLIVNTTPVGMHPHVDATPWEDPCAFSAGQIVYDLIYNPERTRLLAEAEREGATVLGGLDMLIGQAAAAYVQWTGREMPTEAVIEALRGR